MSHQQAQNTVRTAAVTDRVLLEFLDLLVRKFPGSHFNVVVGNDGLGEFNNIAAFESVHGLDDWTQSRIITSASARILDGRTTVHFHRFVTEFGGNPLVRIQSPWETEVWVQRNNNPAPTQQEAIAVMREVDAFRARALGPAAHEGPSSDVLDVAKRQLADLTDLHNQIVYGADEARRNADREFDARRARLEEEWEERRKALESEHDVKRSHILEEESAVKQLQKELDDRGHMHARRELRADITKSLKERLERPGVSGQTTLLRMLFIGVNLFAIALFAIAAWYGGLGFSEEVAPVNGEQPNLQPWILAVYALRISLPTAAAVGLLFYLLNWIRRIHAEDVRSERELERYRYDIDRASWVVETILEAQTKEAGEVPQEWVHGVTHNMFARNEGRDEDHHALDALGALLGISAKAELGPTGPKLELRRDGLRRLGRAIENEN